MAPVIKKQGAIARDESKENATEKELDAMFDAQKQWLDVRRRMDHFIERHFGKR